MSDFGVCEVTLNDAASSELGDPRELPVLIHFTVPGGGKDSRGKMLKLARQLRRRGHKARYRSFGGQGGAVRFCMIGTNASPDAARDAASDHFARVDVDLRPAEERMGDVVHVLPLDKEPTVVIRCAPEGLLEGMLKCSACGGSDLVLAGQDYVCLSSLSPEEAIAAGIDPRRDDVGNVVGGERIPPCEHCGTEEFGVALADVKNAGLSPIRLVAAARRYGTLVEER